MEFGYQTKLDLQKNWIKQNLTFDFLTHSNERLWLVGRMFSVVSTHVVVLRTVILLFDFNIPKLQNTLLKGWLISYFLFFPHIEQLEKSAMTTQEDKENIQSLEGNDWITLNLSYLSMVIASFIHVINQQWNYIFLDRLITKQWSMPILPPGPGCSKGR